MICRNLVTVNYYHGAPISYMECWNHVTTNDLWSPIPYMECRDLVTANDLWFPHTLYGMWEPCNNILHTYRMWKPFNFQRLMVPFTLIGMQELSMTLMMPKPYIQCGNLVTVNNSWSPYTLYGMQQLSMNLMASHTLYGMWESCNCQ